MGSCVCKSKKTRISREQFKVAVIRAIEDDRLVQLERLVEMMSKQHTSELIHVDDPVITVQGVNLNALAYCFRLGRCTLTRLLLEHAHCSLDKLYASYREVDKSPMDVLCEYGHLDLLRYFLPIHIQYTNDTVQPTLQISFDQGSLFADTSRQQPLPAVYFTSLSPIQRATDRGHRDIVKFLVEYFAGMEYVPREFDVHAEDDRSGENCALVAARTGNTELIRYLHEKCQADFHKLNKRKESALQLAIIGLKRHPHSGDFLNCIKYLIEVVKVDLTYEYEETLLLSEDKAVIDFLEKKLHANGITANKQQIESAYALGKDKPHNTVKTDLELEERIREAGPNFQLRELFRDELLSSSYISSISARSVSILDVTPQIL